MSRSASFGAWSETARVTGSSSSAMRRMPGTMPTVETVIRRAEMPKSSWRRVDRLPRRAEVRERLAHPHEHDVGDRLRRRGASRARPARRSRPDRGGGRSRPGPSRRTCTPSRTRPGRTRRPSPGPGDTISTVSISRPSTRREQPLHGVAVVAALLDERGERERERRRRARSRRSAGRLRRRPPAAGAASVERLPHLVGAVAGRAPGREPRRRSSPRVAPYRVLTGAPGRARCRCGAP